MFYNGLVSCYHYYFFMLVLICRGGSCVRNLYDYGNLQSNRSFSNGWFCDF